MKKTLLLLLFTIITSTAFSQIPFYATPLGKGTIYGYFEYQFQPGENNQGAYTYWQYGLTNWLDLGFDFQAGVDYHSTAFTAKLGYTFSKWFSIGAMIQPWFNSSDKFKFGGLLNTVLLQGSLTNNEKLFWLTNTEIGCFDDLTDYYNQQWCLGYNFELKNGDILGPMTGIKHSLHFNEDVKPFLGLYYNHKRLGVYLWGNSLAESKPEFSVGLEFTF